MVLQTNMFWGEGPLFGLRLQKRDSVIIVLQEVKHV